MKNIFSTTIAACLVATSVFAHVPERGSDERSEPTRTYVNGVGGLTLVFDTSHLPEGARIECATYDSERVAYGRASAGVRPLVTTVYFLPSEVPEDHVIYACVVEQ